MLYRSANNKFIFKSLSPYEVGRLLHLLPAYSDHIVKNPSTLLARYYGLYEVTLSGRTKSMPLLAMENLLDSEEPLGSIFDLKGSRLNRQRGPLAKRGNVLMDQDLKHSYEIPKG